MDPTDKILIVLLCAAVVALFLIPVILWVRKTKMNSSVTQRHITDADLIKLFSEQPDGLLSPHRLAELTELNLSDARSRLTAFFVAGLVSRNFNRRGRYFYQLREPYQAPPEVAFSADPFLTVEDLMRIFKANGGRLSMQRMLLSTRLPLNVLTKELKHFEQEGYVEKLTSISHMSGGVAAKFYVLQEPYRSNPSALLREEGKVNLELKELLSDESLYV